MTEPFLALTANSRYWDKNSKIVFLGDWCLREDSQAEWKDLNYEMMPSPWEDREKFFAAADDASRIYENLLSQLAKHLNSIHGVHFNLRYWRILLGPWLMYYVNGFYGRYCHIKMAQEKWGRFRTMGVPDGIRMISTGYREFFGFLCEDAFNLAAFSEILSFLGHPYEKQDLTPEELKKYQPESIMEKEKYFTWNYKGLLRYLRYSAFMAMYRALGKRCSLTLFRPQLSFGDTCSLILKSGFRIGILDLLPTRFLSSQKSLFDERRQGLADLKSGDEFCRFLISRLPYHFPALYLEGYGDARRKAIEEVGRVPEDILSAFGWSGSEHFKFIAAECTAVGGVLRSVQHGGVYGISKLVPHEDHEKSIVDVFYVWGWANSNEKKTRNLPSPNLEKFVSAKKKSNKKLTDILFVTNNHTSYFLRFDTMGEKNQEYVNWRIRFVEALDPAYSERLVIRLHPLDYGRQVRKQLENRFKKIRFNNSLPFRKQLIQSRMAVVDHNSTPLNEILAFNIPTIIFWNPLYWECREDAVNPYLTALEKAGILYYSPEVAAAKINRDYDAIEHWWQSESVQAARKLFVNRFAFSHSDWASQWIKEFKTPLSVEANLPAQEEELICG